MSRAGKRYAIGERVIWLHQTGGGYGDVIPAVVVGHTAKRVRICAILKKGKRKLVYVDQRNLCNMEGV